MTPKIECVYRTSIAYFIPDNEPDDLWEKLIDVAERHGCEAVHTNMSSASYPYITIESECYKYTKGAADEIIAKLQSFKHARIEV